MAKTAKGAVKRRKRKGGSGGGPILVFDADPPPIIVDNGGSGRVSHGTNRHQNLKNGPNHQDLIHGDLQYGTIEFSNGTTIPIPGEADGANRVVITFDGSGGGAKRVDVQKLSVNHFWSIQITPDVTVNEHNSSGRFSYVFDATNVTDVTYYDPSPHPNATPGGATKQKVALFFK